MSTPAEQMRWTDLPARELLGPRSPGLLICASRDPDAKLTYLRWESGNGEAAGARRPPTQLAVKLPTTPDAGRVVDAEGRMLVELRRRPLGALQHTIPRYVGSRRLEDQRVLIATALPGKPMSVDYHQWWHTARSDVVRRDFAAAANWLAAFQNATTVTRPGERWPDQVAESLRGRWDGHPLLNAALARLAAPQETLARHSIASTAVHGDFWFGNILIKDGRVSGVVDWEAGEAEGSPLRDLARWVLSYSLYLDRHTRTGHRVLGHRGFRRTGTAPGLVHALTGHGWYPQLVRGFIADGLGRFGLPGTLWYDVALTGVAEVAVQANDRQFGENHLRLLARLPLHARRYR